jgi:hypothetical protein
MAVLGDGRRDQEGLRTGAGAICHGKDGKEDRKEPFTKEETLCRILLESLLLTN